jgi:hypothetical protein
MPSAEGAMAASMILGLLALRWQRRRIHRRGRPAATSED